MFKPWITIPAEDVRVDLPMRLSDGDIRIMFKDANAIDNTIEQLENLKLLVANVEGGDDIPVEKVIDGAKLIRILKIMEDHLTEFHANDCAELCRSLIRLISRSPNLEVKKSA